MRIDLVVLIRIQPDDEMRLADLDELELDEARPGAGFVEHRMPAHSNESRDFIADLENRGLEFWIREERSFDLREIRDARALRVSVAETLRHVGLPLETDLDWSGTCERCMRIPQQRGQLIVQSRHLLGRSMLAGPRGELLVKEQIAMRMIKEGISGCLLREVKTPEDQPSPEQAWFQILVTSKLPPALSPPTRFVETEDHCEECGQGGLYIDSMLYYDIDDEGLDDINATFEFLGEGPHLGPEFVLSPRFYNLLKSSGAQFDEPEPVVFV